MKCNTVDLGHGQYAFVCTRGMRHNCQFCSRYATKQCDFPIIKGGKHTTCSAHICDRCAVVQALGIDFCPPHDRNKVKIMEARLTGGDDYLDRSRVDEERTVERDDV
jgi:hypothetical protein